MPPEGDVAQAGLRVGRRRAALPRPAQEPADDLPRRHQRDGLRHAARAVPGHRRHVVPRRRRHRRVCSHAAPSIGALLGAATSGWASRIRRQGLAVLVSVRVWGGVDRAVRPQPGALARRWSCSPSRAPPTWSARSSATRSFRWPRPTRCAAGCKACSSSSSPAGRGSATSRPAPSRTRSASAASVVSGGLACIAGVALLAARYPSFAGVRRPRSEALTTPERICGMSDYELRYGGESLLPRRRRRHRGALRAQHRQAALDDRPGDLRPGLRQHRVVRVGDHLHRRRRRHPALPRLPDRPARRVTSTFLETSYLLIYGELPTAQQLDDFEHRHPRRTRCCTRTFKSFFAGFPRDAHPMAVLSSAVSALSTFYQDSLDPFDAEHVEHVDGPAAGQAADDRGVRVQEVRRPAVPLPRQLARLRRELPAHDASACPAEAYEVDPIIAQGARHAVHPARRPRAELLDVDGADGRLVATPTCSRRSRPASTRCSARCTAAPTRPCSRCCRTIHDDGGDVDAFVRPGQGQGARRQADGLRPPRLQELRPARGDREEGDPPTCSSGSASPTRCSTSR